MGPYNPEISTENVKQFAIVQNKDQMSQLEDEVMVQKWITEKKFHRTLMDVTHKQAHIMVM